MREARREPGSECAPPPWRVSLPGPGSRRWGLVWTYIWLAYLIWPVSNLWPPGLPAAHRVIGAAGLAVFLAAYIWSFREPHELMPRRAVPASLVILALGFGLTWAWGPDWFGLLIFGTAVGARAQPRWRALTLVATMVVACGAGLLLNGQTAGSALALDLTCGLIGFAQLGLVDLIRVINALRAANAEIARLAAVEERMRIARDVHDLLGHSLSVIALKADLAHRLLQAGEATRAATEMAEVQGVARRSLSEVREAVAGYRRPGLSEELVRVREMLEDAGIRCACSEVPPALPDAAGTTLAWVVREAATNVLRHSGARICRIQIERGPERVQGDWQSQGVGKGAGSGRRVGMVRQETRGAGGGEALGRG